MRAEAIGRRVSRFPLHKGAKEVIAILPGFSRMPIHRGHDNVERFAGRGKMDLVLLAAVAILQHFSHEAPERLAHGHGLIQREEAVAIELDKDPLWPAPDADVCAAPPPQ